MTSGVGNVIPGQSGFAGTIVSTADPVLDALQNNGGLTDTMALLAGSSAVDAGDSTICSGVQVNNLDQRGTARPIDGDADGNADCDAGAYEAPTCTNDTQLPQLNSNQLHRILLRATMPGTVQPL